MEQSRFIAPLFGCLLIAAGSPALAQDQSSQETQQGPDRSAVTQVGSIQQEQASDSRIGAQQISGQIGQSRATPNRRANQAYLPDSLTPESADPAPTLGSNRPPPAQGQSGDAAPQITQTSESGNGVSQLTKRELAATLAQLSEAEREIILKAIDGEDVCENPPDLPAIKALCENRIETRSAEFTRGPANSLSAEERLLGENLDRRQSDGLVGSVDRLARNAGRADTLETQAIASVALGTSAPPPTTDQPSGADISDLPAETQAIVNALIQQLGGGQGGP